MLKTIIPISLAGFGLSLLLWKSLRSKQLSKKDCKKRKLSSAENFFCLRVGNGQFLRINHSLFAKINGPLDESILQLAAVWLMRKYEIMRCKIVRKDWNDAYFEEVNNCKPTVIFSEYESEKECIKDFECEMDEPGFKESSPPFFKIHAFQNKQNHNENILVCSFLHAVDDAISSFKFMDDLIKCCHFLHSKIELPQEYQSIPPPMDFQLEKLVDWRFRTIRYLKSFWTKSIPKEKINATVCLSNVPEEANDWKTRFSKAKLVSLDEKITSALLKVSKENQTTLHATLSAALIKAAANFLKEKEGKYVGINHVQSINVRPFIDVSNDQIGLFVSGCGDSYADVEKTPFWELAKKVKESIVSSIESKEFAILWKQVAKYVPFMTENDSQCGRSSTTEISNAGFIPFPCSYGKFKITELYFAPGTKIGGALFFLGVATVANRLCLTFVFTHPILKEDDYNPFTQEVVSSLEGLIKSLI